jgi:uncharacterized protein (DUF2062 family)
MPRKLLRRYLADSNRIRDHWLLRRFAAHLHHPRLWHLNRRSVSGATGLGLFVAFLPVPFQILPAALGAIWFRVNLPLSVAWIFVTNPLTMGPIFYLCYKFGAGLLGATPVSDGKEFSPGIGWLLGQLADIWQPLLTGSLIIGVITGTLGYILVELAWRAYIFHKRGPLLRQLGNH